MEKLGSYIRTHRPPDAKLEYDRMVRLSLNWLDTHKIKEKLFAKIASFDLSTRQKMNLYGYFKSGRDAQKLFPVLDKMIAVSKNTSIEEESKKGLDTLIERFLDDGVIDNNELTEIIRVVIELVEGKVGLSGIQYFVFIFIILFFKSVEFIFFSGETFYNANPG